MNLFIRYTARQPTIKAPVLIKIQTLSIALSRVARKYAARKNAKGNIYTSAAMEKNFSPELSIITLSPGKALILLTAVTFKTRFREHPAAQVAQLSPQADARSTETSASPSFIILFTIAVCVKNIPPVKC